MKTISSNISIYSENTSYTPYFYIIQHTPSSCYYAGISIKKSANPAELLTESGYKTSSKLVHMLMEKDGLESFIVRKIRLFETGDAAYGYETRFLKKVKAISNTNFLNMSENQNTLIYGTEKSREFCKEKYGVEYFMQSPLFSEKSKETCLKTFGMEHPMQSLEFREKLKAANLEKLGVEWSSSLPENQEKSKQGMFDKHGVEHNSHIPECIEKRKETWMRTLGVENPMQNEGIKQKARDTNNDRYGAPSFTQTEMFIEKLKKTNMARYGVEFHTQTESMKERSRKTCERKYGVSNWNQTEEARKQNSELRKELANRPIVRLIKAYARFYKFPLPGGYGFRPNEVLYEVLYDMIDQYGLQEFDISPKKKLTQDELNKQNSERKKSWGSRPILKTIKAYCSYYKRKIPNGLHMRSNEFLRDFLIDLIDLYGIQPTVLEPKKKLSMKESHQLLASRPILKEIKDIQKFHKIKYPPALHLKSDAFLKSYLAELRDRFEIVSL